MLLHEEGAVILVRRMSGRQTWSLKVKVALKVPSRVFVPTRVRPPSGSIELGLSILHCFPRSQLFVMSQRALNPLPATASTTFKIKTFPFFRWAANRGLFSGERESIDEFWTHFKKTSNMQKTKPNLFHFCTSRNHVCCLCSFLLNLWTSWSQCVSVCVCVQSTLFLS